MGHVEQVVYFWVHIARRLMTDSKTEARIDSARSVTIERGQGVVGKRLTGALSEEQRKQIDDAFDLFDDNKDGRIDARELKVLGSDVGWALGGDSALLDVCLWGD